MALHRIVVHLPALLYDNETAVFETKCDVPVALPLVNGNWISGDLLGLPGRMIILTTGWDDHLSRLVVSMTMGYQALTYTKEEWLQAHPGWSEAQQPVFIPKIATRPEN